MNNVNTNANANTNNASPDQLANQEMGQQNPGIQGESIQAQEPRVAVLPLEAQVERLKKIYYAHLIKIGDLAGENHVLRNAAISMQNEAKENETTKQALQEEVNKLKAQNEEHKRRYVIIEKKSLEQESQIESLKTEIEKVRENGVKEIENARQAFNEELCNLEDDNKLYKDHCHQLGAKSRDQEYEIECLIAELEKNQTGPSTPTTLPTNFANQQQESSALSSSSAMFFTSPGYDAHEGTQSPEAMSGTAFLYNIPEVAREEVVQEEGAQVIDEDVVQIDPRVIRPGVIRNFQDAIISWEFSNFGRAIEKISRKHNLNLSEYMFNPNGEEVVPQIVRRAPNQCTFYQNQRRAHDNNIRWTDLDDVVQNAWKKLWKKMEEIQNAQFALGLIRFQTTKRRMVFKKEQDVEWN